MPINATNYPMAEQAGRQEMSIKEASILSCDQL